MLPTDKKIGLLDPLIYIKDSGIPHNYYFDNPEDTDDNKINRGSNRSLTLINKTGHYDAELIKKILVSLNKSKNMYTYTESNKNSRTHPHPHQQTYTFNRKTYMKLLRVHDALQ